MSTKLFSVSVLCAALIMSLAISSTNVYGQEPTKKDIKKANELIKDGHKQFNRQKFREALTKYAEAAVLVPNNGAAHFWKGYSHYNLKEFDQSLAELNKAYELGHPKQDIYKVRWFLNYQKKDYDAAMSDIAEALKSAPADQMLLRASGDIYYAKTQYSDALVSYQKALAGAPNDANLYYAIARMQYHLGNWTQQQSAAEEAIKRNTQFLGDAMFLRADALHKQKRYAEALDAYLKALPASPDMYEIYRSIADLYRGQNRYEEAIDISRQALRRFSGNDTILGNIYTDLSWYYSLADKHEEAIQTAQSAIKLLPKQYIAYTNLCRAFNDVGKPELAINACNDALKIQPNDGETYFYLARANGILKRDAEAARLYKRAITGLVEFTKNNPDYSDGYYLLGNAYFSDDQPDRAIDAYQKCLSITPTFAKARFNLGILLVGKKQKERALEQYNSLLNLDKILAGKLKTEIDKL
jgi:superkiller protein 3